MQTSLDFDKPASGYSWDTSYPALKENPVGKALQAEKVYQVIKRLGETCLIQISEQIDMPQSSVAGRVNNLIDAGRVRYCDSDNYIFYKNRLRKKIVAIK